MFIHLKKLILKRLENVENFAKNVANTQDYTKTLKVIRNDEIGNILVQINNLMTRTSTLVADAKSSSSENAAIANQLSSTSLSVGESSKKLYI